MRERLERMQADLLAIGLNLDRVDDRLGEIREELTPRAEPEETGSPTVRPTIRLQMSPRVRVRRSAAAVRRVAPSRSAPPPERQDPSTVESVLWALTVLWPTLGGLPLALLFRSQIVAFVVYFTITFLLFAWVLWRNERDHRRTQVTRERLSGFASPGRAVGLQERCPYCHDQLGGSTQACSGCDAVYHEECALEQGGCAILGCGNFAALERWRRAA